jgi:hypothetical protein
VGRNLGRNVLFQKTFSSLSFTWGKKTLIEGKDRSSQSDEMPSFISLKKNLFTSQVVQHYSALSSFIIIRTRETLGRGEKSINYNPESMRNIPAQQFPAQ